MENKEVTTEIIEDVAAELGIDEPSLVEKDYYVVKALSLLQDYESPYFKLVFGGGTCLSKVFPGLQRMSEDVDIKVLLTDEGQKLSRSGLRNELSAFKSSLKEMCEKNAFDVKSVRALNENHFIELELEYSRKFDVSAALRPNIKIELTLCEYECQHSDQPITSLISGRMGWEPEVAGFSCVDVVNTSAEKLVSLLRRTSASLRGIHDWADDALVRHIYDLHVIDAHFDLDESFIELVKTTVVMDGKSFSNRHRQFHDNPIGELRSALNALKSDKKYRQQFESFLGPLVYAEEKPGFDVGINTLEKLVRLVWGEDFFFDELSSQALDWEFSVGQLRDGRYQGVAERLNSNGTLTRLRGCISSDQESCVGRTKEMAKKYG